MAITRLTSKANPILKTIRLVLSGSRNAPKQVVAAEGIRVLEEAHRSRSEIVSVVLSEHFGSTPRERALLDNWGKRGVRMYRIAEKLFASVSSVRSPQGALALVRMQPFSLDEAVLPENPLVLYACAIQDPGNLGTLIRTAAAAAADLVCTTRGTVSARNPKSIRSSAGAVFHLPVAEHVEISHFRAFCSLHSIQPYRTDPVSGTLYTDVDLDSPCAILLGNEGSGMLQEEFRDFPAVRIPMASESESLNVAVAGSIILYEAFNQRRGA
jgi:TrmH family RNA methyltransferase